LLGVLYVAFSYRDTSDYFSYHLLLIAVRLTIFISLITNTVHMLLLLVLSGLLFVFLRLKSGGGDRAELTKIM
jgi:hypothetical protein